MTPEERAIKRLAFVMQLARDWPEFDPRIHEPVTKYTMPPLAFLREMQGEAA